MYILQSLNVENVEFLHYTIVVEERSTAVKRDLDNNINEEFSKKKGKETRFLKNRKNFLRK